MYYEAFHSQIPIMINEAKDEVALFVGVAVGIWALIWVVQVLKSALDEKEYKKFELDRRIDDYLAGDDADDFFSHYGPDGED